MRIPGIEFVRTRNLGLRMVNATKYWMLMVMEFPVEDGWMSYNTELAPMEDNEANKEYDPILHAEAFASFVDMDIDYKLHARDLAIAGISLTRGLARDLER